MTKPKLKEEPAKTVVHGVLHEQSARLRDRVEPPADQFKDETAEHIENLAEQVRTLGRKLDRRDEAHRVARRLERTADYLRFRPSAEVGADVWRVMKRSRALWIAGGLMGAYVAYRFMRKRHFED